MDNSFEIAERFCGLCCHETVQQEKNGVKFYVCPIQHTGLVDPMVEKRMYNAGGRWKIGKKVSVFSSKLVMSVLSYPKEGDLIVYRKNGEVLCIHKGNTFEIPLSEYDGYDNRHAPNAKIVEVDNMVKFYN